jgi:hypothetical protein
MRPRRAAAVGVGWRAPQPQPHVVELGGGDHQLPAARREHVGRVVLAQHDARAAAARRGREPGVAERPVAVRAQPLDRPPHLCVADAALEQRPHDGRLGDVLDGVDARLALGL